MKFQRRYLLFILLLVPPFIFRDYSPENELKYISMAEQAWQHHTWFTFYDHGEIYADKPPLYFWLMLITRTVTGSFPMWALGMLSLLPAIAILLVMDSWMRTDDPLFDAPSANCLLVTTGFFLGGMLVLRMDMLMTFFIVLALYTFYRLYRKQNRPYEKWAFPVYIFLALFTKGPVGLIVPLLSAALFLAVKKELKTFGRYFGVAQVALLLILCAVWFGMVYREGGTGYLQNLLFKQTVGRSINAFRHDQPFYYYLLHLPLTWLPWTLLYFSVLLAGAWKRLVRTDTELLFSIVIGTTVAFLSLISSKLDIYLLPIYPFVAYLTVRWMQRLGDTWYIRAGVGLPAVLFIAAFPAWFSIRRFVPYAAEATFPVYAGLVLLAAGGVVSLVYLYRKQAGRAVRLAAAGLLAMIFAVSFAIPPFNRYIGLEELVRVARKYASENATDAYAFYKFRGGKNMDVYLQKPLVEITTVADLEEREKGHPSIVFLSTWELKHEPDLAAWLRRQERVISMGEYKMVVVGKK